MKYLPKLVYIIGLLTCINASAASIGDFIQKNSTGTTIHTTTLLTNGKVLPGQLTLILGTGQYMACKPFVTLGPVDVNFVDNEILYLDGKEIAKEYGLDLTCAIESFEFLNGHVTEISYDLVTDKAHKKYLPAIPSQDIVTLK